jgi:hypothetical protein
MSASAQNGVGVDFLAGLMQFADHLDDGADLVALRAQHGQRFLLRRRLSLAGGPVPPRYRPAPCRS